MMSAERSTASGPVRELDADTIAERQRPNAAVLRMLQQWLADESGYDEDTWDSLKAAMKESRRTMRDPFRD
jgi:hypothetical protein